VRLKGEKGGEKRWGNQRKRQKGRGDSEGKAKCHTKELAERERGKGENGKLIQLKKRGKSYVKEAASRGGQEPNKGRPISGNLE